MKRQVDVADIQLKTQLLQSRGIEVGLFVMFGYDGETMDDIDATVAHLKKAAPDLFLTTVAYPIKGTPYYEAVADRLVAERPWTERTDRDLRVAGRHADRFYEHTTRWVVNEVNLHRARRDGTSGFLRRCKLQLNAWRGRLGMYLTHRLREEVQPTGGGRGWTVGDRVDGGW
jgi:radical SAM superfamily enzyme YgiQ (UPF0313 family)